MTWFDRLNPVPAFPSYTGPYKVGSTCVEIPAVDLQSPSPAPSPAPPTVAFRIFYPCRPESRQGGVHWIPDPQREYVGAYARFLGVNSAFSQVFALVPQLLYYISIPVHRDAEVLEPQTKSKRWPVMVFSHGLGGSMNSYSHLLGSLSSHGLVVVAPDHRDGSSPVSFVQDPETNKSRQVEYRKLAHKASTEVYEGQDEQLKIRLWELGLVHDAIIRIDKGQSVRNLCRPPTSKERSRGDKLAMFSNLLQVHEPGSISYAGHSFGAASVVQFVKSSFYPASRADDPNYKPLFTPSPASLLTRQITSSTPVLLLDLWTLPLNSPATRWLREKPMPGYQSAEGGSRLLAILSEAFFKWSSNLRDTIQTVSKPAKSNGKFSAQPGPHIFYPIASAHLSQSDFGILFPWVTTKIFGAKEPERVLRLNMRAILQLLRGSNIEVADTTPNDREILDNGDVKTKVEKMQDLEILSTKKDVVRGWISLNSTHLPPSQDRVDKGPMDAIVEGEVLGEVVKRSEH